MDSGHSATSRVAAAPNQSRLDALQLPPAEEKEKNADPLKDAHQLYEAMKGGLFGAGTDEEQICRVLQGKTAEQIAAIKTAYKDHYNRDLVTDLRGELSGDYLKRVDALLQQDKTVAEATEIHRALTGAGTDEEAIHQVLRNKQPEELQALSDSYRKLYGVELDQALEGELSGAELDRARAVLKGNKAEADAARLRLAMDGAGTSEETIREILSDKSKAELSQIADAYKKLYGKDLEQDLATELNTHELSEAKALLEHENITAACARLKAAIDGVGTTEEEIFQVFEGRSAEERQEIIQQYQALYKKDLLQDLQAELGQDDLLRAKLLIDNGKLSDAERLYFAMQGAGTDEEAIKEVLHGKSKAEIQAIATEYESKFGRKLVEDLESDLSGRAEFKAHLALLGEPTTLEERLDRLEKEQQFERSGLGSKILDTISDKGQALDENVERARRALQEAQKDGVITEEEKKELSRRLRFAEQDVETYVGAKDAAAETAGTVAATVAATVVMVGTAGAGAPLVFALATAAGAAGYVGGKAVIEGGAYEADGVATDLAVGAVEGVATAASAGAAKGFVSALKSAGNKVFRAAVGEGAEQGVKSTAKTLITKAVTESSEFLVKEGTDGAIGGAAGGIVREGAKGETWEKGLIEGLSKLGQAAAAEAAAGAVGGVVGNVGMRLVGHAATGIIKSRLNSGPPLKLPSLGNTVDEALPLAGTTTKDIPQSAIPGPDIVKKLARDANEPTMLNRSLGGKLDTRISSEGVVEYRAAGNPETRWKRLPNPEGEHVVMPPTLEQFSDGSFTYYYATKDLSGRSLARVFFSSPAAAQHSALTLAGKFDVSWNSFFQARGKAIISTLDNKPATVLVNYMKPDIGGYDYADFVSSIAHEYDHHQLLKRGETLPLGRGMPVPEITAHVRQAKAYERLARGVPEAYQTDENLIRTLTDQGYPKEQVSFAERYLKLLREKENAFGLSRNDGVKHISYQEMKALSDPSWSTSRPDFLSAGKLANDVDRSGYFRPTVTHFHPRASGEIQVGDVLLSHSGSERFVTAIVPNGKETKIHWYEVKAGSAEVARGQYGIKNLNENTTFIMDVKRIDGRGKLDSPSALPEARVAREEKVMLYNLLSGLSLNRSLGEKIFIGPLGDIQLASLGKAQDVCDITIRRLDASHYQVTSGLAPSTYGTFVHGKPQRILGSVEVQPGEQLRVGHSSFEIPRNIAQLPPEAQKVWAKLEDGETLLVGRGHRADISFEKDSTVSRFHATLHKGEDGKYYLSDGLPASRSLEVRDAYGWRPIADEFVPEGSRLRIGGKFEFTIPDCSHPYMTKVNDVEWRSPDPLDEMIRQSRAFPPDTLQVKSQVVQVYGTHGSSLKTLRTCLDREYLPIREIHVVHDLGIMQEVGKAERLIHAFPIDDQGTVVLSSAAFKNPDTTKKVFDDLLKLHERRVLENQQFEGFTRVLDKHLAENAHYRPSEVDGLSGRYADREFIGRTTGYNTRACPRGINDCRSVDYLMVVDDGKSHILQQAYQDFYQRRIQGITRRGVVPDLEEQAVYAAFAEVRDRMQYNLQADLLIGHRYGVQAAADRWGWPVKIDFGFYIKEGVGVCEHQALYVGYLLEKLQREGLLSKDFRVSHGRNQTNVGAHSWARIDFSDGRIWIADPARNYVGPLRAADSWFYTNRHDRFSLEVTPI